MQFQVPQFIEVEDKLFGPLTFKQFLYITGGIGLCILIFLYIPGPLFLRLILMAPVVAFSMALAFFKINNKPFVFILEAALKYYITDKLYIWRKVDRRPEPSMSPDITAKDYASVMVPKIGDSKLKDLTWNLDIKESLYTNKNQK